MDGLFKRLAKLRSTYLRALLGLSAVGLGAPVAASAPISTVFDISETASSLEVRVEARGFSDTDVQALTGTIDVTFDFAGEPFPEQAGLTVTGANVAAMAPFQFRLGLPRPFPGATVVASGIVADVTTPAPPGTMTLLPTGSIMYQFDASQFLITADEGVIDVTGFVEDTSNLADEPVSGASPVGTLGKLTLVPGDVIGFYREVDAHLDLPISIADVALVGDPGEEEEVLLELEATVRATASFYLAFSAIPGDFDQDGDVDGPDLSRWRDGFGTTADAALADGDADSDGDVDGNDFLDWQRNLGTAPPTAIGAVPEPASAISGLALFAGGAALLGASRRPANASGCSRGGG